MAASYFYHGGFFQELKEQIQESTAHGIPSMASSSTKRSLFWLFTFLGCSSLVFKQSSHLISSYLQEGMTVAIDMVPDPHSRFPRVTLCSHNLIDTKINRSSEFRHLETLNDIAAWEIFHQYCQKVFAKHNWTELQWLESAERIATELGCWRPAERLRFFSARLNFSLVPCLDPAQCLDTHDRLVRAAQADVWAETYRSARAKDYSDVTKLFRTSDLASIASAGLQLPAFLVQCSYKHRPCTHTHFVMQQTDLYGNCYTFVAPDHAPNIPHHELPSYKSGLALTVRIDAGDNAALLTSSRGVRLAAHDALTSHAVIEDEGVSASLGTKSMITFSKKVLKKGAGRKLGCIDQWPAEVGPIHDIRYDNKLCKKFCNQHAFVAECSCTVSLLYHFYNPAVPFCYILTHPAHHECWRRYEETATESLQSAHCDALCQTPCTEIKHEMQLSELSYPSLNTAVSEILWLYNETVDKPEVHLELRSMLDVATTSEAAKKISTCFGAPWLQASACLQRRNQLHLMKAFLANKHISRVGAKLFRERYAQLYVFHDEREYELIEEFIEIPLDRILSEIGGVLGLWVGLSLVTMVEFVELGFLLLHGLCSRMLSGPEQHRTQLRQAGGVEGDTPWQLGCAFVMEERTGCDRDVSHVHTSASDDFLSFHTDFTSGHTHRVLARVSHTPSNSTDV